MQHLLNVRGLVAGYAAEPVLRGIDLTVRAGSVVAVLGANGVGIDESYLVAVATILQGRSTTPHSLSPVHPL